MHDECFGSVGHPVAECDGLFLTCMYGQCGDGEFDPHIVRLLAGKPVGTDEARERISTIASRAITAGIEVLKRAVSNPMKVSRKMMDNLPSVRAAYCRAKATAVYVILRAEACPNHDRSQQHAGCPLIHGKGGQSAYLTWDNFA